MIRTVNPSPTPTTGHAALAGMDPDDPDRLDLDLGGDPARTRAGSASFAVASPPPPPGVGAGIGPAARVRAETWGGAGRRRRDDLGTGDPGASVVNDDNGSGGDGNGGRIDGTNAVLSQSFSFARSRSFGSTLARSASRGDVNGDYDVIVDDDEYRESDAGAVANGGHNDDEDDNESCYSLPWDHRRAEASSSSAASGTETATRGAAADGAGAPRTPHPPPRRQFPYPRSAPPASKAVAAAAGSERRRRQSKSMRKREPSPKWPFDEESRRRRQSDDVGKDEPETATAASDAARLSPATAQQARTPLTLHSPRNRPPPTSAPSPGHRQQHQKQLQFDDEEESLPPHKATATDSAKLSASSVDAVRIADYPAARVAENQRLERLASKTGLGGGGGGGGGGEDAHSDMASMGDNSADLSSSSGDWGTSSTVGAAGSPPLKLKRPPAGLASPSPSPQPPLTNQLDGVAASAAITKPPAPPKLEPYRPEPYTPSDDDTPSPPSSLFPLPPWLANLESDADRGDLRGMLADLEDGAAYEGVDADHREGEEETVVSVGEVPDDRQRRPSRSVTLAAASAAPIKRMALRAARRSRSVEALDQAAAKATTTTRSARLRTRSVESMGEEQQRQEFLAWGELNADAADGDDDGPDFSMPRGPLSTVPGSPETDANAKHVKGGVAANDDKGKVLSDDDDEWSDPFRADGGGSGGEEEPLDVEFGFEKPHDLIFRQESGFRDESIVRDFRNKAMQDETLMSPASPRSSSDQKPAGATTSKLSRWRARKRRQQQQKNCDQLVDDEGNIVARATPRAAPWPVRLRRASDGFAPTSSSSPQPHRDAPPQPPESAPPAMTTANLAAFSSSISTPRLKRGGSTATSRRLGPAFDEEAPPAADAATEVSTPSSSSLHQRAVRGHLEVIADEAESDNLADVAATAAMSRAAAGSGRPPGSTDPGGEDVPLWKQLLDYFRYRPLKKKILTITVILSVVLVIIDFNTLELIRGWMEGFLWWMNQHPIGGFFAFIGLFIVTTLVFIPPSILTFGAGFVFARAFGMGYGVFAATLSCFAGASSGAVLAFFRARYMMRDLVKLFSNRYPLVKAADAAIKHKGFRIMFLLRLCPLIPFNALNYIGGVTAIHWQDYTFALVGLLPFMITTIFLGATAGTVSKKEAGEDQVANIVSIAVGCGISVVSVAMIWYFARKELHREIADHRDREEREEAERRESSSDVNMSPSSEDELERSLHSWDDRMESSSDLSLAASRGDSSAADGGQRDEDAEDEYLNDEQWYWLWT